MTQPPIAIIGAGIGGLVLGRTLAKHAIPYVIYERFPSLKQYNYGVTLLSEQLDTLSTITGVDRAEFISHVAVDGAIGGTGRVETRWPHQLTANEEKDTIRSDDDLYLGCFRANRGKIESLLVSGLNIQYGSNIRSIDISSGKPIIEISTEESDDDVPNRSAQHDIVIAADGVHSTIRQCLLPFHKPQVARIVAIYGKRRVPKELLLESNVWYKRRSAYMDFKVEAQHRFVAGIKENTKDIVKDVVTRISIANVKDDAAAVDIEWVYSRPSRTRGKMDPLCKPDRSTGEANVIHESFFDEVRLLHETKHGYPALWSRVFDIREMKTDRKLSWLMRTVHVPEQYSLKSLAEKGVLFIGDSIHAEPIIGGQGYNNAIHDATILADELSQTGPWRKSGEEDGVSRSEPRPDFVSSQTGPSSKLGDFYTTWRKLWDIGVRRSEWRLRSIHDARPAPPHPQAVRAQGKKPAASFEAEHKL